MDVEKPMRDDAAPALSALSWSYLLAGGSVGVRDFDGERSFRFAHLSDENGRGLAIRDGDEQVDLYDRHTLRAAIAAANAALPDDDPAKITRARLDRLRSALRRDAAGVRDREEDARAEAFLDALELYIRPE